jgi:hypothetical protein
MQLSIIKEEYMNKKNAFISIVMFSFILLISGICLAQAQLDTKPAELEVQWIWGEVVSVDSQRGQLTVKYLDYESEMENTIVVLTDEKTAYENINSLSQIKPLDNVSIDYVASQAGNIAKNISIEKAEGSEEEIKPETPPLELPGEQETAEPSEEKTE